MRRCLLSVVVSLSLALPLVAYTPLSTSSASQNTGTTRAVMEPVIAVQSINGVTQGTAASINFPNPAAAPDSAQIQVAHTYDFVSWSQPVTLPLNATNGITYDNSADPVLIDYGPNLPFYTNWLFCFGTLWKNTNYHGRSTIGVWHSVDGGVTWGQPDVLDAPPYNQSCEASGTCVFDDKPAAALCVNGTILVSFTRVTQSPSSTQICVSYLIPSRGWVQNGPVLSNMPDLPGPTPVFTPSTAVCYLYVMDRANNSIRTFTSGDYTFWNESAAASAPGLAGLSQVVAGQSANRATTRVQAYPFLSGKYDSVTQQIFLTYHRLDPNSGVSQAVFRRFDPAMLTWSADAPINANGHTQWNPTIAQLSNGHFVFTYYDYNSNAGDIGYSLYFTRMSPFGQTQETSRIFIQGADLSDPNQYNFDPQQGVSRIGECQGLAVRNDVLYAATTYMPQSSTATPPRIGNVWVAKFTTP